MDKNWMTNKNRMSDEYIKGVNSFIEFAEQNVEPNIDMPCPCFECLNLERQPTRLIRFHLHRYGMNPVYKIWNKHGETIDDDQPFETYFAENVDFDDEYENRDDVEGEDEINGLLEDIYMGTYENDDLGVNMDGKVPTIFNLLDDVQKEVYSGCSRFTILSFVIKMFHMKVLFKWSDISFNELLKVLKMLLPECDKKVPWTLYEAKKFLRDLGLGYEIVHACKYDCALFWKENVSLDKCPVCDESRYKLDDETGRKIPHKVLRYFPLAPRLKRLFMSRKTAIDMRWHKEKLINDGTLRHPADGKEWKDFDKRHLNFAAESRNVRLGLASDGFNPFGDMSNANSLWPVIVTPYNLPPWKCMKEPYCIMSLLIPGPSAPGRDIDIYMQPLIDELKILWDIGIPTYDAATKQTFQMHVAVLWTINDFPAYANLSGWSTKGYFACPVCNKDNSSQRLVDKIGYTGARRFLPENHRWRKSKLFNGQFEHRSRPQELSGEQILQQLDCGKYHPFGKNPNILKTQKNGNNLLNWKKKSIFWELPYWKTLNLRHNLDVMHIEKNICDNVLSTLLNIDKKTKDTDKTRLDLENLRIREHLHLKRRENGSGYVKPQAPYTLSMQERKSFCEFLKSVKYPDGYAANIARCANAKEGKVTGIKSHDCHILLQRLIPIGMRGYLDIEICSALFELGNFFRQLCSKTLKISELEKLEGNIILVLCKLELIFPPAFFDIMVHLAIHLPHEALLGGPVQFRWMYPIERLLGLFKEFVSNRAHPEGSIAERYIDKECTTFCSMYLGEIKTAFNKDERNEDSGDLSTSLTAFAQTIRTFGEIVRGPDVSQEDLKEAHWFVLNNSIEVEQYLNKHEIILRNQGCNDIGKGQRTKFRAWFQQHMNQLRADGLPEATDELWSLAYGPGSIVNLYSACISNGVRFLIHDRDKRRITQNSGVFVMGDHNGKMHEFYGYLSKVWELNYMFGHKIRLFQCEWFNTGSNKTYKSDVHVTTINVGSRWYRNDPFVFPSQVQQVFYVNDTKLGENWRVVEHLHRRGIWDVPTSNEENLASSDSTPIDDVALQQDETVRIDTILVDDSDQEHVSLSNNDVDDVIISDDVILRSRKRVRRNDDGVGCSVHNSDDEPLNNVMVDDYDIEAGIDI